MANDYVKVYVEAIKNQYGADSRETQQAYYSFLDNSIDKNKLPEYLHGLYDEVAAKGKDKSKIDTPEETRIFHSRAYYTIDRNKVPENLLDAYDKIAKLNNNCIIDSEVEANKFKSKVTSSYNYGEISLDKVKGMGFTEHKKQGSKVVEYAENGLVIGQMVFPIPIINCLTGAIGGVIGGTVGVVSDAVELVKKGLGKQNDDLVGFNNENCKTLHDKLFITKSLCNTR